MLAGWFIPQSSRLKRTYRSGGWLVPLQLAVLLHDHKLVAKQTYRNWGWLVPVLLLGSSLPHAKIIPLSSSCDHGGRLGVFHGHDQRTRAVALFRFLDTSGSGQITYKEFSILHVGVVLGVWFGQRLRLVGWRRRVEMERDHLVEYFILEAYRYRGQPILWRWVINLRKEGTVKRNRARSQTNLVHRSYIYV